MSYRENAVIIVDLLDHIHALSDYLVEPNDLAAVAGFSANVSHKERVNNVHQFLTSRTKAAREAEHKDRLEYKAVKARLKELKALKASLITTEATR